MLNIFTLLKRDLFLFLASPRDYIFSFTYSNKQRITITKYDPAVKRVGENLVTTIKKEFPNLPVYFIGSASLELPGQRDIDIMIAASYKDFGLYIPFLLALFGNPTKKRKKFIEWHFQKDTCDVEILFIDPSLPVFQKPLASYEILKRYKHYRNEYRLLKLSLHGTTIREYKRKRMEFFNRIIHELHTKNTTFIYKPSKIVEQRLLY